MNQAAGANASVLTGPDPRQLSSDTEVVGNLLVLLLWLRQRDNGERTAIIINNTGNQNDDNSAMRSRSIGSTRHH